MEKQILRKINKEYFYIAGLVAIYFIYLVIFCNIRSLWMDDLAQIKIGMQDNLQNLISENISLDNNPPLSHILSYFWIRIVPYGTGWLKLMNIIFVSIGIYFCGLFAYRRMGLMASLFCVFLAMINKGIIYLAAYTIRPYGLFFFLSAVMLYLYSSRLDEAKNGIIRNNTTLLYSVIMTLMVYTHYFAVLICITLFIYDLWYVIKRKIRIRDMVPYPVSALLFSPWLVAVYKESSARIKNFWPKRPSFSDLIDMIDELMGRDKMMWIFVAIVLISMVFILFFCEIRYVIYEYLYLIVVPIISIGLVYVVSKYAKSISSLFVTRYFTGIMPYIIVLGSISIYSLWGWIGNRCKNRYLYLALVISTCIMSTAVFARSIKKTYEMQAMYNEPFCEVSEYLKTRKDYYDNNVMVFNTCNNVDIGWDYYLTEKYEKPSRDVIWYTLENVDFDGIDIVYVAELHLPFSERDKSILIENGFQSIEDVDNIPLTIYYR